jgi:DNA-binding MarR family transcriptional regulator
MVHPRHRLDDAFQTPLRFSLMAALGPHTEIDFQTLRDVLETEDSNLSKAISHLEKAGYVKVTKGYVGNRPRTWIEATTKGHRNYRQHLLALRAITEGITDDGN